MVRCTVPSRPAVFDRLAPRGVRWASTRTARTQSTGRPGSTSSRLRDQRLARLRATLEAVRPRRRAGLRLRQHPLHDLDAHRHVGGRQDDPVLAAGAGRRADRVGLRLRRQAPSALQPVAGLLERRTPTATRTVPHHGADRPQPRNPSGARAGISTLRGAINPAGRHGRLGGPEDQARAGALRAARRTGRRRRHRAPGARRPAERGDHRRRRPAGVPGGPADQDAATRSTCSPTRASMVDAAYENLYEFLRPGVRENECVGVVAKTLYDLGSEFVEGVNAISGERCAPHPHVFSDRIVRPGDPAFFDILHSYNGYRTCYYRTFAVGSASSAQRDAYTQLPRVHGPGDQPGAPRRDDGRHRVGLADGAGVRLPGRGGSVRPAVRPRCRPVDLGEADLLPAGLPRAPGGPRGGHGVRPRDVLAGRRTAGARPGSRRSSWSRPTAARSSRSSPPRTCSSAGQRYFAVGGPLPTLRDTQSHLNTAAGTGRLAPPAGDPMSAD